MSRCGRRRGGRAGATWPSISLLLVAGLPRLLTAQTPAVPVSFPTPAEKAGYLSFTAPDEVGPYLARLADEAEGFEVDTLAGPPGIPIARLASRSSGDGAPVARVLVVGAQHGIERAGTEVALRLARDLAVGRLSGLRRALEVRIVPMANPWGVANRRRAAESGVDLDADHVRLAAGETRALWDEYTRWQPDLVLDLHELGPSEYGVQVGVPTHPNAPATRRFARFYMLPYVANRLARRDIRFHEYVASWIDGRVLERAAVPAPDSLGPDSLGPEARAAGTWFTPPPMAASSALNAFALAGSVSFFVAVSSSRDIIGLEERTDRLYLTVQALLETAAGQPADLIAAAIAARRLPKDSLALRASYVAGDAAVRMPWVFINDRGQREQGTLSPWRPEVEVQEALTPPAGWWVAADQQALVAALRAHGFRVGETAPDDSAGPSRLAISAYPRCPAAEDATALRPAGKAPPVGALWVPADQPGARLLFTLIEPWSQDGWFADEAPDESASECAAGDVYPVYRAVP